MISHLLLFFTYLFYKQFRVACTQMYICSSEFISPDIGHFQLKLKNFTGYLIVNFICLHHFPISIFHAARKLIIYGFFKNKAIKRKIGNNRDKSGNSKLVNFQQLK